MKKVLLRVDFNVPIKGRKILDDFRIKETLPTIKALLKKNQQVFIITHLEADGKLPHLDFMLKSLERLLKTKIHFLKGRIPEKPFNIRVRAVLFDNIRLNSGETKNDPKFVRTLAGWGDYYINEAFSASHRKHASIVGIPKYLPSVAGPLLKAEIKNLSKFFKPKHPFLFILGGKKFETKEPLISRFLKEADAIFIAGALANTFLKQRGIDVKKSKTDSVKIPENILWSPKIFLPEDWIEAGGMIYDAGPRTVKAIGQLSKKAKFILWNGTLGLCEKGYDFGTRELGRALGGSRAFRLVGGGDTVAAIRQMHLEKNFDFISTGGGAMLEFLAKATLPGIEALKRK